MKIFVHALKGNSWKSEFSVFQHYWRVQMQIAIANNLDVTVRIPELPGADPKERCILYISFICEGDIFF